MVIVHGKSEYVICKNIQSNLRIPQEIISRNQGKTSIQITSLMSVLNDRRFKTYKQFIKEFENVKHGKNRLENFRLFTIMDMDDCTEEQKDKYVNRQMFKNHWLFPYIVPIFNSPNLERTMQLAGIQVNKKADYVTLFPTNHGDLDMNKAQDLLEKLQKCKSTNMNKYIEYCLGLVRT